MDLTLAEGEAFFPFLLDTRDIPERASNWTS